MSVPRPKTTETLQEIDRFRLRFACEDCVHFAPTREACAHGYPTEPHRLRSDTIVFCKEFELA